MPARKATPLINKVTRMRLSDLDEVLTPMRMNDANKRRVREYLVEGKSMREIATQDECSPELVSSAVNRVRIQLNKSVNPWAFTTIALTIPLTLAEELRGLCDGLAQMDDTDQANHILKDVLRAVALAKMKMIDHAK